MRKEASNDRVELVSVKVQNTGIRAGAEVVQLYVHDGHSKIDRPAHELKGFSRVELKPGESKTVEFKLDRAAFNTGARRQKHGPDPGTFEIQVGASSRDIRLKAPVDLITGSFRKCRKLGKDAKAGSLQRGRKYPG